MWSVAMCLFLLGPDSQDVPFEQEIRAFEASDSERLPTSGSIVFVGSSSIAGWSSLQSDFPNRMVLNRGFGGSQLSHSVHFAHRIVTKYEPRMVVLFAGTNDLADGVSPEKVYADYKAFVSTVREKLPTVPIVYISISPAPSRWHLVDRMRKVNRLVAEYGKLKSNLKYVDIFTPMLDRTGRPRPELFQADQLHMNRSGYEIWIRALKPIIDAS